ncbi:hypothetical protein IFM47457_02199 [Aspergillus lentulus]|nr:hypothetical protein IFM47457_02199 [Aspergillus lentulus]
MSRRRILKCTTDSWTLRSMIIPGTIRYDATHASLSSRPPGISARPARVPPVDTVIAARLLLTDTAVTSTRFHCSMDEKREAMSNPESPKKMSKVLGEKKKNGAGNHVDRE